MDRFVVEPQCHGLRALLPSIPYGPENAPMVVVRGRAGTGKTIMVADFVLGTLWKHHRFTVGVFDVEQGEEQARRLIGALGHVDLAAAPRLSEPGEGGFHYHDCWTCDRKDLADEVRRFVARFPPQREAGGRCLAPGVVVIDSLNAVAGGSIEREEIRELRVNVNRDRCWWLLFVCEADPGEDAQYGYLDYEADIVLWLTKERDGPRGHSRRMLEIVKCRNAGHERGKHQFAISAVPGKEGGEGGEPRLQVRVFPSLASQLSKWGREAGRRYAEGHERAGLAGLTQMLGGEGVPVGSATAYVGPPGSRKGPCALHFAIDEGKDQLKPGRTLIVSLAADEAAMARLTSDYESLGRHLLAGDGRGFREDQEVAFRWLPPGYASAGGCIADIRGWLEEKPKPQRVIVSDLSQLEQQFPVVQTEEDSFLSALVELFRSEGITSLFVETTREGASSVERGVEWSKIGGLVDNLVEFRHLFFYGSMHVGVSVTRRHGAAAETGFWELRTHRRAGKKRALEAMNNLHGFTNLFTGEPKHVPLNVYVYEDSEPQRVFNARLKGMLRRALPGLSAGQLKVQPFGSAEACYTFRAFQHATETPQPDIRIATIDEFWAKRLLRDGKLAECPEGLREGMARRWEVQYDTHVPSYLNVGLIVAEGKAGEPLKGPGGGEGERAGRSWGDLKRIAAGVLKESGDPEAYAFDFGKEAGESWSSMLLEVLSSAGTFATCPKTGEVEDFRLSADEAVEELKAFCELFWSGRERRRGEELCRLREDFVRSGAAAGDERRRGRAGECQGGDRRQEGGCGHDEEATESQRKERGGRNAGEAGRSDGPLCLGRPVLYRRLWYAELAELTRGGAGCRGERMIFGLPGEGGRGRAMRGEWYWCVLRGSVSAWMGWEVIDWLTTESIAARQYLGGVGLPAHSCFYKTAGEETGDQKSPFLAPDGKRDLKWVLDGLWRPGLSRAGITQYPRIAPLLAHCLYSALCLTARYVREDGGMGEEDQARLKAELAELMKRTQAQVHAIRAEPEEAASGK